ncbi:MAG: hypothetical protein K0R54_3660 [Clostridiaceae bacterium]|nr:hypothetical protein [Clostridiaceae bacterium]
MLNKITAETNIIPAHHMDLTPIINVNRPPIKPPDINGTPSYAHFFRLNSVTFPLFLCAKPYP